MGGSFNPAHAGHVRISLLALRLLDLDCIWWLVSPQNPLKSERGMAPYGERLASARALARHGRIQVSEAEARLGTRFTADTVAKLLARHPRTRFVWIMGADNLIQIARWQRWPEIFARIPIAVFDRPTYSLKALAGQAARRFARARIGAGRARHLATSAPPRWVFLDRARDPISATALRQSRARNPGPIRKEDVHRSA